MWFWWGPCCPSIIFLRCPIMWLFEFSVVMSVTISTLTRCSVHLYFQLFVGGFISYLRYLYLFRYGGLQHMLCCVFALFFFILCTQCCQFLWIVHFCLALQYFLIVCLQSVDGISDLGDPFRMLKQFSFIKG